MTGTGRRRGWGWFGAWLLVGAAYALSLLSAATIGILVIPIAIIATVMLAIFPRTHRGGAGLISGLGFPPLYVAYLNRSGPGNVCRAFPGGGGECVQEFNPWPWLAAAVLLFVAGEVLFLHFSSRPAEAQRPSGDHAGTA